MVLASWWLEIWPRECGVATFRGERSRATTYSWFALQCMECSGALSTAARSLPKVETVGPFYGRPAVGHIPSRGLSVSGAQIRRLQCQEGLLRSERWQVEGRPGSSSC